MSLLCNEQITVSSRHQADVTASTLHLTAYAALHDMLHLTAYAALHGMLQCSLLCCVLMAANA